MRRRLLGCPPARGAGAWAELELDTRPEEEGAGGDTVVWLAHLRSYRGMGTALIECVSGCTCAPAKLDGTWQRRASLFWMTRFIVSAALPAGPLIGWQAPWPSWQAGQHWAVQQLPPPRAAAAAAAAAPPLTPACVRMLCVAARAGDAAPAVPRAGDCAGRGGRVPAGGAQGDAGGGDGGAPGPGTVGHPGQRAGAAEHEEEEATAAQEEEMTRVWCLAAATRRSRRVPLTHDTGPTPGVTPVLSPAFMPYCLCQPGFVCAGLLYLT